MRVAVVGTGLLGETVAECTAEYHTLTAPEDCDVLWVCYDTPVTDDVPDVDWVCDRVAYHLETTPTTAVVLVSSQVPVGTCSRLEAAHPDYSFVVNPENLRRGRAKLDFLQPLRHICGARQRQPIIDQLLGQWAPDVLWMSPESAEMGKHALNGFLALSIAYANEIGDLCGKVGANAEDVEVVMKSDRRVGYKAYLTAGGPYTGGTLGRDIHVMRSLGAGPVIQAVAESNGARL